MLAKVFGDTNDPMVKRRLVRYSLIIGAILILIIIIIIIAASSSSSSSDNGGNGDNSVNIVNDDNGDNGDENSSEKVSGSCPDIKYVSGGLSGSGFASRYWDCCKPSCSWTENAGSGNEAKQCDVKMNLIEDHKAKSICEGGPAATCLSQIPFTMDDCDNIGFAFAAVPGGSKVCGQCFLLEFTGEGKYETKKNHALLKNKKLIVIASNIGYDVSTFQFDVMIPGGGVGIFNGCEQILGNNMGKQYGGLLSDCEEEVGYSVDDETMYTKRKECLSNKCKTVFSSNTNAKQGCLFLAEFMEAAGNPLHNFKQIECPDVIRKRY